MRNCWNVISVYAPIMERTRNEAENSFDELKECVDACEDKYRVLEIGGRRYGSGRYYR